MAAAHHALAPLTCAAGRRARSLHADAASPTCTQAAAITAARRAGLISDHRRPAIVSSGSCRSRCPSSCSEQPGGGLVVLPGEVLVEDRPERLPCRCLPGRLREERHRRAELLRVDRAEDL